MDDDKVYVSHEHYDSLPRHHCRPGDVIVGTLGDPNLRACILPQRIEKALNKADCVQVRPNTKKANTRYLCWLLNQPGTLHLATRMIHGQTRLRVSMGQLRGLKLPSPPLDLQHYFAAIVESTEREKTRLRDHDDNLTTLAASLQQRAFRGNL